VDDSRGLDLTLSEWLVLCPAAEQHLRLRPGRAVGPQGSIGRMWCVRKINVYRALRRLESLGLVQRLYPAGPAPTQVIAVAWWRPL